MREHFEDFLAGRRRLICVTAHGPSQTETGYTKLTIYHMVGAEIEEETTEWETGPEKDNIRLELMAVKRALESTGATDEPVIVLSRNEYLAKHAQRLRENGFKKANGGTAANADIWEQIVALDPHNLLQWHFATRPYDEEIEDWKEEVERDCLIERAMNRDPY